MMKSFPFFNIGKVNLVFTQPMPNRIFNILYEVKFTFSKQKFIYLTTYSYVKDILGSFKTKILRLIKAVSYNFFRGKTGKASLKWIKY